MLYEAGLPPSFLGEAINAYVHIWNQCPTASLSDITPYELWHKRKPNVSNLRVWGCASYVHVQKDQRSGIGSHMQKCVFIGYPDGYKGWKFYNPITKKVVISERAEFDERYFPGLKHKWDETAINPDAPLTISEYLEPSSAPPAFDDDETSPVIPDDPPVALPPSEPSTPPPQNSAPLVPPTVKI